MVGSFFARNPLRKQINVFMGKLHKMHPNYMANLLSAMTLLSVITQNYTMQFFNELKKLQGHIFNQGRDGNMRMS